MTLAAGTLTALSAATVPPALAAATAQAALSLAAGLAPPTVSAAAAALSGKVVRTMLLKQLRQVALALVALTVAVAGVSAVARRQTAGPARPAAQAPAKGTQAAAKAKDKDRGPAWGEEAGGVRVRAAADKTQWRLDESPRLTLDLKNEKAGELGVLRMPECELEIDGVWYAQALPAAVAGAYVVREGETHPGFTAVLLEGRRWARRPDGNLSKRDRWVHLTDPKNRLRLTAGKHTLRVAVRVGPHLPVSNPVAITIAAAK